MAEYQAKVSFHDMQESAVEAVVSIADDHLAIEVSGRSVGRWPIGELSPRLVGDSLLVSAEGEHLVIDVTDPDALGVSLLLVEPPLADAASLDHDREPTQRETGGDQKELRKLETALAEAQTQLRWVQDLVPRRLPVPLRAQEAGLGVVQGVRLKERRPLPGADGLQPWVVVDTGNVYVTTMRLIFSGAQDVEFEFDDIDKKGASSTGLLLGVSSRIQSHILAGPGERLAVVLTAAEKIAKSIDPTLPFKEAILRLTSEIANAEGLLGSSDDAPSATEPASAV